MNRVVLKGPERRSGACSGAFRCHSNTDMGIYDPVHCGCKDASNIKQQFKMICQGQIKTITIDDYTRVIESAVFS